jgi:hypothetical protein
MNIRPFVVLASGAASMTVATLHAALSYRRNAVSHATFADIDRPEPNKLLMTTNNLFEIDKFVGTDEVSPDLIADVTRELVMDLLNQASDRSVGLDWGSFRLHLFEGDDGSTKVIARADVL